MSKHVIIEACEHTSMWTCGYTSMRAWEHTSMWT